MTEVVAALIWDQDKFMICQRPAHKARGLLWAPFILNATEFNVSQKRERVFFIGIRGNGDPFFEYNMSNLLEDQKKKAPIVRDLLASLGRAPIRS